MRLGPDDPVYVVTDPGPDSTEADILFKSSLRNLELQFRGGLTMACRPTLFTDESAAKFEALGRMTALRVAALIGRKIAEGQPIEGAVRVEILDGDGKIVFEADLG